jgi:hypothetical protein
MQRCCCSFGAKNRVDMVDEKLGEGKQRGESGERYQRLEGEEDSWLDMGGSAPLSLVLGSGSEAQARAQPRGRTTCPGYTARARCRMRHKLMRMWRLMSFEIVSVRRGIEQGCNGERKQRKVKESRKEIEERWALSLSFFLSLSCHSVNLYAVFHRLRERERDRGEKRRKKEEAQDG